MTKEEVIRFRNIAGNNPIVVTCDNQHIFYDNMKSKPPIIWDDVNEDIIVIGVNQSQYDQQKSPVQITLVNYEQIHFLETYVSAKDSINIADSFKTDSLLTADEHKDMMKFISEISGNTLPKKLQEEYK